MEVTLIRRQFQGFYASVGSSRWSLSHPSMRMLTRMYRWKETLWAHKMSGSWSCYTPLNMQSKRHSQSLHLWTQLVWKSIISISNAASSKQGMFFSPGRYLHLFGLWRVMYKSGDVLWDRLVLSSVGLWGLALGSCCCVHSLLSVLQFCTFVPLSGMERPF